MPTSAFCLRYARERDLMILSDLIPLLEGDVLTTTTDPFDNEPVAFTVRAIIRNDLGIEEIIPVTEEQDPEAWRLAADASMRKYGYFDINFVAKSPKDPRYGDYQVIYAAHIRKTEEEPCPSVNSSESSESSIS